MARWIVGAIGLLSIAVVVQFGSSERASSEPAVQQRIAPMAPSPKRRLDAGVRARAVSPVARSERPPEGPAFVPEEETSPKHQRKLSVRLDELSTYCWGDPARPSEPYAGEPIDMFALRIPTRAGTATAFDFCIEEVRFGDVPVVWEEDGRVDGAASLLGLGGTWLPFSDEVTSWEVPQGGRSFAGHVEARQPLCVKGTAPEVFEGHYGDYWGAAVGFRFQRATRGGQRPGAYRPRFTTIQLTLGGRQIPDFLTMAVDRNAFQENNESWCKFLR